MPRQNFCFCCCLSKRGLSFFLMMFYVHTMFVFSVCVVVIVVPVFIALVNAAVVVVNQSVADL